MYFNFKKDFAYGTDVEFNAVDIYVPHPFTNWSLNPNYKFNGVKDHTLEGFRKTLDDSSIIYSDLKIPEIYASVVKKGLPIKAKFSGYKNKSYEGQIDGVSSRINADTRSLLTRIKINNENFELIPGSLIEVTVNFNVRKSLGVPDTSLMLEGNKAYVYKISENNIANKTEIKIGIRDNGFVEVLSGLNDGDIIVAEGLKKVRPKGKIKPIKK